MADVIKYNNTSGTEASNSSTEISVSRSGILAGNPTPPKNTISKKVRTKMQQSAKMSKEEEMKNRFNSDSWAMAPEFVPRDNSTPKCSNASANLKPIKESDKSLKRLCPNEERDGLCRYPSGECAFLHGDMCDLCAKPALHPHSAEQRRQHTQACIRHHEADMELAFAAARSNEMVCGVCFEIVLQKAIGERRFGILPNCNHCFCLACIRKWRSSRQFENKIIRACPECRVTSDFVCPSTFWVNTKEDKQRAIENYLRVLSVKDCKYFLGGRGCCPFGNKCFYRHCMRDGTQVDVGPPPSLRSANGSDSAPGNGPSAAGAAAAAPHETNNLLQVTFLYTELVVKLLWQTLQQQQQQQLQQQQQQFPGVFRASVQVPTQPAAPTAAPTAFTTWPWPVPSENTNIL